VLTGIRGIGFAVKDALWRHVESRLESALGPVARRVSNVTARLEDVSANRGGFDKRCSLVAALRLYGVVVAEATNSDLYAAADEAATRLRRSAMRAVTRHVSRERRVPPYLGALTRSRTRAGGR
jgi:ribosomal subunit interface protein